MTSNIWFAFPALTSLLIQAWLIINSNKRTLLRQSNALTILFVGLFGICSIEFFTFLEVLKPSLILMKLYYVSCFFALTGLVNQAASISSIQNARSISFLVFTMNMLLSAIMISTHFFISGIELISYSYTRIPGEFYFIVQFYLATLIILIISLLILGYKGQGINSKRAKLLLISLTPILVIGFMIIVLMQVGVNINASIIFPILTTYFLLILIHTEKEESLFHILMKIPFSKEKQSLNQITKEIQNFLISAELFDSMPNEKKNLSLKTLTTKVEKLIVDHAVEITKGSQVQAASLLGVSTSSICRKKNHEIKKPA